jgi:hypothetical protein
LLVRRRLVRSGHDGCTGYPGSDRLPTTDDLATDERAAHHG